MEDLNKETMLEELKTALKTTEDEKPIITFVSAEDESAFFPAEVDGWKIVRREGRLVPRHYQNNATYIRIKSSDVEAPADEEATPSDV